MRYLIILTAMGGLATSPQVWAKPKKLPLAAYRPSAREFLVEEVRIERFHLEDADEKKWLDLSQPPTLSLEIPQKKAAYLPTWIGSLQR